MKKIISIFIICLVTFLTAGCDKSYVDHPISGKIYWYYGGSKVGDISVYIYFYSDGKCDKDMLRKTASGDEHNRYDKHFTWKPEGNGISIYHDNSSYWKSSVRGTLLETYRYDSSKNILIDKKGTEYVFCRDIR